ncbi:Uncharacterised protein [Vibrio cholerae]|nr:Uncharacterised protein [Vibrio cholerae]
MHLSADFFAAHAAQRIAIGFFVTGEIAIEKGLHWRNR